MSKVQFNPSTRIPSLADKVILITGGTAGLGHETVLAFAAHDPAHIYFTGRSESSAARLVELVTPKHPQTTITFVECDLASLASVKMASKQILSQTQRLDVVMANAGIMTHPPGLMKDGYEIQFGTNHIGHAMLVKQLTPLLAKTASTTHDVRIFWNTSRGYGGHPRGGILFDKVKMPQADIHQSFQNEGVTANRNWRISCTRVHSRNTTPASQA